MKMILNNKYDFTDQELRIGMFHLLELKGFSLKTTVLSSKEYERESSVFYNTKRDELLIEHSHTKYDLIIKGKVELLSHWELYEYLISLKNSTSTVELQEYHIGNLRNLNIFKK